MPNIGAADLSEADRQLLKALGHEVRAGALAILNSRVASPKEIAQELGLHVGNVSYHVNELAKYGCIELVSTEQRRGATEHFYRSIAPRYLTDEFWSQLSPEIRDSISLTSLRILIREARDSMDAGLFDGRDDRHLSVFSRDLDEQGWTEIAKLYEETLNRAMAISASSERRIVERGEGRRAIRTTFGLLAFESAPAQPDGE